MHHLGESNEVQSIRLTLMSVGSPISPVVPVHSGHLFFKSCKNVTMLQELHLTQEERHAPKNVPRKILDVILTV